MSCLRIFPKINLESMQISEETLFLFKVKKLLLHSEKKNKMMYRRTFISISQTNLNSFVLFGMECYE